MWSHIHPYIGQMTVIPVAASTWKFVLLGVAFVCLLIGFLLLGMGSMANK